MRPRTRVRFPPPPLQGFQLIGGLTLKRRQIWRRLCVPRLGCAIKRLREFIEVDRVRGRTGQSVYKLRLPLSFARRPVGSRPTDGLAILWCRASGDWLSLGAEPVF